MAVIIIKEESSVTLLEGPNEKNVHMSLEVLLVLVVVLENFQDESKERYICFHALRRGLLKISVSPENLTV